jgi:hypothetical protein
VAKPAKIVSGMFVAESFICRMGDMPHRVYARFSHVSMHSWLEKTAVSIQEIGHKKAPVKK